MDERWSLVCLNQLTDVGWQTVYKCWQAGWRPGKVFTSTIYENLKNMNVKQVVIERIRSHFHEVEIQRIKQELAEEHVNVITVMDSHYPQQLREIAQPPWVLYTKGDIALLESPMLAVVGSRKPTPYGVKATHRVVSGLVKQGLTIVSGMAFGIDATAHQATLKAEGKTIAVLGTGVNVIYPKSNRQLYHQLTQKGLVISEMPLHIGPHPGLFPRRNRIISGLSLGCLVVEAAERSGSLITADCSLEQNREVFAVPGQIDSKQSQGTLQLIKQGAKCIVSSEDILEELRGVEVASTMEKVQETPLNIDEKERIILQQIGSESVHLSQLYEQLVDQMTYSQYHQAILTLEMKGMIIQISGMRVMRGD